MSNVTLSSGSFSQIFEREFKKYQRILRLKKLKRILCY
jgi:hypothetical protein